MRRLTYRRFLMCILGALTLRRWHRADKGDNLGLGRDEGEGIEAPPAEPILLAGVGLCPIGMRMGPSHDAPSSASHPEPSAGPDLTPIRPGDDPATVPAVRPSRIWALATA